jgi:hypothetical protein
MEMMRCYGCEYLNYDFLDDIYEHGEPFCGLHGRAPVDPNGPQQDLNHHGGCGYSPIDKGAQTSLF